MLKQFQPDARCSIRRRWSPAALVAMALVVPMPSAALELTGRVVDNSGSPVAEARVELQRVPPLLDRSLQVLQGDTGWIATKTVRTSKEGEFLLVVPEVGMWQVEISVAAKVPVRCRLLPLLEDETLPDAVLESDAGLEVRVEDGAGSPLDGAQVWIQPVSTEGRRSRRSLSSPWKAAGRYGRTGMDGRVKLARQAGQKVRVHAFVRGYVPGEMSDLETPSATLRLTPGKPVTVRVRAASGEPVPKAVLTVSSLNWVAASTDGNGEASVFVAPGEPLPLTVRRATGQVESTELMIATADPGTKQESQPVQEWRLPEPIELSGIVLDQDTREPVERALVWTSGDAGAFQLSGTDGRYMLVRSEAQRWFLQAAAPGYGVTMAEAQLLAEGPRVPTLALARAGAITGRVIDPQGEAIADAVVRVTTAGQLVMARTDVDGAFRLGGLTAVRPYELAAEADGFAPEVRSLTLEPDRFLEIVLHRGGSLTGRLVTPDHEPVAGGRVYLVAIESDPRMRSLSSRTESPPRAQSDNDGRFRLDELPRRPMALVARHDGMADKIVHDVDLTGGESPLDLGDIELEWGVELRGQVRSRNGPPIEGAVVMIFGGGADPVLMSARFEDDPPPEVTTDVQGRFEFDGLARGQRYNASVRHEGYVNKFVSEIDPGAREPLEIVLDQAARVSGRVLDGAGVPVERVRVSVQTLARDAPPTNFLEQASAVRPGYSRADGSFEVTGVLPGRIEISVAPGRGWIASEPLAVTLAAGEERRDLVLRVTTGSELTGKVTARDGRPVIGADVQVSSGQQVSSFNMMRAIVGTHAQAKTDGDGAFALRGLDPAMADLMVAVNHPDFAALEQPVEIRPGSNRLDLVLQEGVSLAGVVITEAGEPVEGAEIAVSGTSPWPGWVMTGGGPTAESRRDGTFELKGLASGVFELQARKSGFAASTAQSVEIGDGLGALVTLTLLRGGTIRGRILGLEPDELSQVMVLATGQASVMAMGLVGENAQYRIPNVGISEGNVMASNQRTGQTVHASFTLDTRGGETWLDLEFGAGSSLTGVVLLNGEPIAQAMVVAQGGEGGAGTSVTDTSGRFRIGGLEDDAYRLMVMVMGTVSHSESVQLTGDTELTIDISNIRVSGRVLAENGGEPIAGAEVWATVENEMTMAFGGARAATTTGGEFELFVPASRPVVLRAKAPDYAEGSLEVNTGPGGEIAGLELVLPPGAGLELDVALWTGTRPGLVSAALVDANGNRVLADTLMRRPAGRFRLPSAPPGDWTLLVSAEESAVFSQAVTVPGPPVEIVLQQSARISIEIASPENGPASGKVRVLSPSGGVLRFPVMGQVLSEWPVFGPRNEIPFVPAGNWVVELIDNAGTARNQAVTAVAGEVSRVIFD